MYPALLSCLISGVLLLPVAASAQSSYNWWDARKPAPVTAPARPAPKPAAVVPALAPADSLPLTSGGYLRLEQMPVFPGGQTAMLNFIQKTLQRPRGPRLHGQVMLNLEIAATGEVTDVQVAPGQGLSTAYDMAAVECVSRLPKFTPGRRDGKAVAMSLTFPVYFK